MNWTGLLTSISVGRWATSVDTKPTHQLSGGKTGETLLPS